MCPYMKGIGYSVVIINILMLSYYNTLQAYALYYLAYSFQSPVPWSSCSKPWSTSDCHIENENATIILNSSLIKKSVVYLPTSEFFKRKVLSSHLSLGFDDPAGFKLDMLFCLFIIFLITTLCLVGGIKSSGKAVYVTALLPYLCLIVLIIQSLLLDGSFDGLSYYLKPDFTRIFELKVWIAAAVQTFFSLGPGFGVLITYSSYTNKSTNIKTLTILCSIVNCFTSLLYGLVVFAGLGYMAKRLNVSLQYFLDDGIGLVFIV
jgi:solute carrier family 6 serotonin transporter-like protein 4